MPEVAKEMNVSCAFSVMTGEEKKWGPLVLSITIIRYLGVQVLILFVDFIFMERIQFR